MPDIRTFRFTGESSRRGIVYRPLVQVRIAGPARSLRTQMLLDTGSDISMVKLGTAEELGLDLGEIDVLASIGVDIPGYRTSMDLTIEGLPAPVAPVRLPVFVPIDPDLPPFPVLGRDGFLQAFDVRLAMGPIPSTGTFSVSAHP